MALKGNSLHCQGSCDYGGDHHAHSCHGDDDGGDGDGGGAWARLCEVRSNRLSPLEW